MTSARDPHATLGLEPGASPAEIKRAYRRLAKVLHPDSAGEQSLPAFLAVQEAYERLTGTRVRTVRPPGSANPSAPGAGRGSTGFREPWRADPERARAAREQARARRAGGGGGPAAAAGSGAAGSRPAGRAGTAEPSSGQGHGPRSTRRPGPPPGGASGATGRASAGDGSGAGDPTGDPTSRAGATADGGPRGTGGRRRRATRKATLGSTSYDEARDAADARWAGASWYGPTSGEYWIVNPREYADPRKHGPGYSGRLRSIGGRSEPAAGPAAAPGVDVEDAAPGPAAPTAGPSAGERPAPASPPHMRTRPPTRDAPAPDSSAERAPWSIDLDGLLRTGTNDPLRRIGLVLLAWAPIGIAAAGLIGSATGCATYSAACGGTDPFLPWVAQAIIVGVLLVIAPLTRILAVGGIATVIGLIPATALVIAAGGARSSLAASVLGGALAVAWLAGTAWATWRMLRGRDGAEP